MYTKNRKCALKCHRCNRVGHRVRDCTIPKRNKKATGSTQVLGTLVPEPVQIRQITSVWDEFPEIARPERPQHVTSVWEEDEEPRQQGFPQPLPRKDKPASVSSKSSAEEEWFDTVESMEDGGENSGDFELDTEWENFPEETVVFDEPANNPVLAPHEMEQQFLAERWDQIHVVFRGWNIEPCKTKSQNLKYFDSFFICGQMNHHSHWFCSGCKTMAYVYKPGANTPCQCEF